MNPELNDLTVYLHYHRLLCHFIVSCHAIVWHFPFVYHLYTYILFDLLNCLIDPGCMSFLNLHIVVITDENRGSGKTGYVGQILVMWSKNVAELDPLIPSTEFFPLHCICVPYEY